MNYYLVCPIGVIGGREDLLTYSSEKEITIGTVARIPFGKLKKLGIIVDTTSKPRFATKDIDETLDEAVPKHLIDLAVWISEFYATRLSIVLQSILPKGLDKKRRTAENNFMKIKRSETLHTLTRDQQNAIVEIENSNSITHLLHGITGSGKTRVYQELAKKILKEQKSVLVLVPEISLTPQLATEFEQLHDRVLVLHSGLTESQRHKNWQILNGTEDPWVIVGPRSSLFAPISNLGLIIIDECHEPSYIQDSQPKYSALRVARKLAELQKNAKLVLGSATPAIADYFIAQATGTPVISLNNTTQARNTAIEVVDMRDRSSFGTHQLFSKKLLEAMNNSITQNEQILLFHNRRGTARMSLCSDCGWSAECQNCHIPFRLHHDKNILKCHTCGLTQRPLQVCPDCKSPNIDFKGFGSKRIESAVIKLFPDSVVARFDGDTPENEQLHNRYQDLYDNKIQIIIGTQGIAKGLDLPHLNTVGIIQADSELFIPDYSSCERSFQLTTQVIGRAGRGGHKSHVIIQTLNPDHPAIQFACEQNYGKFYDYEINERSAEHMPPHTFLLHLTTGYASVSTAENAAQKLTKELKIKYKGIFVRGPSPAFHEHRGKLFYQQLTVSSSRRSTLVEIAKNLPQRWQFTLDPINLL